MNTEQTRPDDERPDAPAQNELPRVSRQLGAALASLKKKVDRRGMQKELENETEPLPEIDEEELAQIADPAQRQRERQKKLAIYREFPRAREMAEKQSQDAKAERNKVVMLHPWSNDKRAAPNAVFRSALFPALHNQTRKFIKEQKVYSVGGLDVTFTGEQFDQTDLDVYLEVLNFAKSVPLGQPIRFSAYAMLKALGRCTGKSDHKWLHSVLVRLRGGTVELATGKARYFGGLIEGGIRDDLTKHYDITINPNFAKLFGFGLWSSIDLDQRRALERNSTAKALHAYYSTHAAPGLHRYETLANIAGLEGKNRKAILTRAHEELKRVGFLVSYDSKPNGVEVVMNMTEGQHQHIIKKIAKVPKSP